MQFGIFIYDGVEPIDLATFGVLSMARRIAPEIAICTIAPRAGPVALANGLKVTADFGIDDAPPCDLVIVTGGPGWTVQAATPATIAYIRRVWYPERRARDHQTRGGGAGDLAARGHAQPLSEGRRPRSDAGGPQRKAGDGRRGLALY
jgi:hypothetical protein